MRHVLQTRVVASILATTFVTTAVVGGVFAHPWAAHALGLVGEGSGSGGRATPNATLSCPPGTGVSSSPAANGNGLGEEPWYTYYTHTVSDHEQYHVNVANGNLVYHADDLYVRGTGLDLRIERDYNSEGSGTTDLGTRWVLSPGYDVHVHVNNDSSVTYYAPGDYAATFAYNSGTGTYTDAPGLDATLVKNGDSTFTLTFHKTREQLHFGSGSGGRLLSDTDKNGNTITFSYSSGQLTAITDTQGRGTSFSYNTSGLISKITDPAGRTAQYGYDSSNNLTSVIDADGNTTTYGYSSSGHMLTSVTTPDGHATTFAYNASNQVTAITLADNAQTSFSYLSGETDLTDANSHTTKYDYDSATDLVTKVIDAQGNTQSLSYTADYNVATYTNPLNQTTTFQFDVNNNLIAVQDGNGVQTTTGYTDSTHPYFPTCFQDRQGNVLAYTYDSPGNLTQTQDQLSSQDTLTYTYNGNGTLASATDADGHQTSYGYDAKGNLTSVTPPSGSGQGQTTLVPDPATSRVTSVTDGKGQTTSFSYDNLDHIVKITYNDKSTIGYTYDKEGDVKSLADNTGTTSYTYNLVRELKQETLPSGTALSMNYDSVGNLTAYTDGNSGQVSYGYNSVNELTTLTEPNTAQTSFKYDAKGQRTEVDYPNSVMMTLTYDKAGHETEIKATQGSTTLTDFQYTYTKPGTTTPLTDLRYSVKDVANNTTTYTYDALNRLIEAKTLNGGGSQTADYQYTYDGAGNRLSQMVNGTTTTYSYNAGNELTANSSGTTYSYDADGNLTGSSAGLALTYNSKNQTTQFVLGGTTTDDTYSGPTQTERVQQGSDSYTNGPLGVTSRTPSGGSPTYYVRDNKGQLMGEELPSGAHDYYLFDGLGSVVGLTNSTGAVADSYAYDPYGNVTSSTGSVVNPWQYAAGNYDARTGYTKFGLRYYDPQTARWTQQDPLSGCARNPAMQDRYSYADEDPVNVTDSTGAGAIPLVIGCLEHR